MSGRQGWEGTVKVPTAPTERPNLQAEYVSAHIRVYWPYTATDEQVAAAIFQAASEAADRTRRLRSRSERAPVCDVTWTEHDPVLPHSEHTCVFHVPADQHRRHECHCGLNLHETEVCS